MPSSFDPTLPGEAWYEAPKAGIVLRHAPIGQPEKFYVKEAEALQAALDWAWQQFGNPQLTLEAQRALQLRLDSRRKS